MPLSCCYERVGLCPWQRDPPDGSSVAGRGSRRRERGLWWT